MVSVVASTVRGYLNIASTDVADSVINQYIADWEGYAEEWTGRAIDTSSCTKLEAAAIGRGAASDTVRVLAAGVHAGMDVNIGGMTLTRDGAINLARQYKIDAQQMIKKLPRHVDSYTYGVD